MIGCDCSAAHAIHRCGPSRIRPWHSLAGSASQGSRAQWTLAVDSATPDQSAPMRMLARRVTRPITRSSRIGGGGAHGRPRDRQRQQRGGGRSGSHCTAAAMQLPFLQSLTVEQSMVVQDVSALSLTIAVSLVVVKTFREATDRGLLSQKLSRKLVHITSGTGFMITWCLFSAAPAARYLAALVPLLNGARLLGLGLGWLHDEAMVNSVSRQGDPKELLRGPLFYVVTMSAVTMLYWRTSPVGVCALALMCGGDGFADIVGRKFGKTHKLPFNRAKSWAGSVAMFVGGLGLTTGFIAFFSMLGYMPPLTGDMLQRLALVALTATVVEALPANQVVDDNISVPIAALLMGSWLL